MWMFLPCILTMTVKLKRKVVLMWKRERILFVSLASDLHSKVYSKSAVSSWNRATLPNAHQFNDPEKICVNIVFGSILSANRFHYCFFDQ